MEYLRPCPFCGGEAAIYEPITTRFWFVRCSNGDTCSTCGPDRGTRSEAIEAWNTRAAVTDEQFAIAVHNAEVLRKESTCELEPQKSGKRRCKRCGAFVSVDAVWDCSDVVHARYCPNCGARVVEAE